MYDDDIKVGPLGVVGILAVIGLVVFLLTGIYSQDAGEVVVLRNLGGDLAGYTEEAGFHLKAPWQKAIRYDIRNNLVNLKGGARADIDLQVVYSLDADAAMQLYVDYGTQKHFTETVIQNDVRATAREVAGQYDTVTMLTNRGQFTKGLSDALASKWEKLGLDVEQVSVQDVRYDSSIVKAYNKAQAAEVAKAEALNKQETAKVQAETKKIEAEGEAAANKVLSESLTPEVVQQHYIDALVSIGENGNLVVVPEGSMPVVQTKVVE